jgi:hypothetical protein
MWSGLGRHRKAAIKAAEGWPRSAAYHPLTAGAQACIGGGLSVLIANRLSPIFKHRASHQAVCIRLRLG